MNIGFFTNTYLPAVSGVTTVIENYREELEKQGHNVYIFAAKHSGYYDKNPNVFRFKSIDLNYKISYPLPLISSPKIGRAIKRINLDIVHSHHFFLSGQIAWYYAKKLKLPLVFTYHTRYNLYVHYAPLPEELSKPLAKTLSTLYANSCNAVVAPSKSIKDLILEYGVRKPIYIIPSGIDIDKFKKTGNEEKIREKYNIKNDAILLLTVCRLSEEKNLTFLLKVFQKIIKKRKNVYFMIVGDGPEKEDLEKQSFRLGLKEKIIFTDKISYQRIPSFYNASDIFLFSSLSEVQPTIFTESMASGLPIVAIKAIGSEDVISNKENGFLVSNDVDDFSQATLKLIDDENLRKKMSEKAKNRAKYFSIENSTRKILALYEKAISQKEKENKLKESSILFKEIFLQK
jgi:glycosyltransferase involved in cell wall biosynthesis